MFLSETSRNEAFEKEDLMGFHFHEECILLANKFLYWVHAGIYIMQNMSRGGWVDEELGEKMKRGKKYGGKLYKKKREKCIFWSINSKYWPRPPQTY